MGGVIAVTATVNASGVTPRDAPTLAASEVVFEALARLSADCGPGDTVGTYVVDRLMEWTGDAMATPSVETLAAERASRSVDDSTAAAERDVPDE